MLKNSCCTSRTGGKTGKKTGARRLDFEFEQVVFLHLKVDVHYVLSFFLHSGVPCRVLVWMEHVRC